MYKDNDKVFSHGVKITLKKDNACERKMINKVDIYDKNIRWYSNINKKAISKDNNHKNGECPFLLLLAEMLAMWNVLL